MKKVAVHFAEGFEEIEGLTIVDILRRAEIDTLMVSVTDEKKVVGAHGIKVKCDTIFDKIDYNKIDMIVLPGGMPGTLNLDNHEELKKRIIEFDIDEKWIGAICAAPTILGKLALLEDRQATCYPGGEKHLLNAKLSEERVVVDKNIITSRGPATSGEFALKLVELLVGKEKADSLAKGMLYK